MFTFSWRKNTATKSNQFDFAAVFLQSLLLFDHKIHFWNMISSWPTCATNICRKFVYYITTCKKEDNKLTDEEKLWLIEFYKGNRKLWVIQGITRSQKALKKGELVEEFDKKFSIAIPEKATRPQKVSKRRKLPNEGLEFYECMLFLKNEKFSIYGATDKICSGKIAVFFLLRVDEKCCLWTLSLFLL